MKRKVNHNKARIFSQKNLPLSVNRGLILLIGLSFFILVMSIYRNHIVSDIPVKDPVQSSSPSQYPGVGQKKYVHPTAGFEIIYPDAWILDETPMSYMDSTTYIRVSNILNPVRHNEGIYPEGQVSVAVSKIGPKQQPEFTDITPEKFFDLNSPIWDQRKNSSGGGGIVTKTYSLLIRYGPYKFVKETENWTDVKGTPLLVRIRYMTLMRGEVWSLGADMNPETYKGTGLPMIVNQIVSSFRVKN